MPVARFEMPDGRIARFAVPEGTSPEQAQTMIEGELSKIGSKARSVSPSVVESITGHPLTRFALGAASPALGAVQLGAEILGSDAVTGHLKQLETMKRLGMGKGVDVGAVLGNPMTKQLLMMSPLYGLALLGSDKLKNVGDLTEGIDLAGLAGTLFSPAVLGAMKIPAAASVLGRSVQGAAIGTGFGAAAPVTSGDDFAGTKGAQIITGGVAGAVIPPAIDITRNVTRVARNILDPILPGGAERGAARIMAEAAGPKRAAIEAELAKNQVLVPGSQPTAAEAAAGAGSPEFSALQKIAEAHKPSAFSDITKAQEVARVAALRGFGKDKTTLAAAEVARSQNAKTMYETAFQNATATDPALEALAQNPYFKDAMPHALKLAEAKGITQGNNLSQFLHYVKLGLDKELTKVGDTALSATEKQAVQELKKELLKWLTRKNPDYEKARAAFASASKPINEMQVGQQLEETLVKPLGAGERAGVFANAVRNAPSTIKKATGAQVGQELGDILQPQNLSTVKNVLADLARKAEMERLIPMGRQRAAQAAQPFGLPATGPLHQSYMIFKTILGRVSKGINEKTLDTMAEALEVPSIALLLLQKVPLPQRQAMIDEIIAQKLGRGTIAAFTEMVGEGMQQ